MAEKRTDSIRHQLSSEKLPQHIAVIMDGNGRWAKMKGRPRVFGHKNGVSAVREVTEACAELGVSYLTLYAFSTENWNRPITEVSALMELLVLTIGRELKTLQKNNVRLNAIGKIDFLPERCRQELISAIEKTKNNTRMTLTLALSYGSREELTDAFGKMYQDIQDGILNPADISPITIEKYLYTSGIPDPELLIRTSGEYRISNFLLWQIAYAELYFTDKFWPDFTREDLYKAIFNFQQRERRFGKISEQITVG
jgi:undecaprenyl diphosphate synthase